MNARTVTLREVADRAGVHPGTVSRTLNEATRHLVNAETAERVLAAVSELGYRPNVIARSLRTNRSLTIGVVVPDLTNPLFPPMVRGMDDRLAASGYTTLIANTDNDLQREAAVLETMRLRQVDGVIAATARREAFLVDQLGADLATVLINRRSEAERLSAVVADDRDGTRQAVLHLAAFGHERIAYIAGPQTLSTGADRYEAFVDTIESCGLDVDPAHVFFGEAFTEAEGVRGMQALLASGVPFTAVATANDLMALGCYSVLAEGGLHCPRDVSVVGYNDMPFADKFNPPLTTVHIPHYELGEHAASTLLRLIEHPETEPQTRLLPVTLVARGSSGPAPQRLKRRHA
jgi:LacI family transcriptional regulator